LAATITRAYLFSTRPSSASRGGLITCRHPRWERGRYLRTTSYCNSGRSHVKHGTYSPTGSAPASARGSPSLRGSVGCGSKRRPPAPLLRLPGRPTSSWPATGLPTAQLRSRGAHSPPPFCRPLVSTYPQWMIPNSPASPAMMNPMPTAIQPKRINREAGGGPSNRLAVLS